MIKLDNVYLKTLNYMIRGQQVCKNNEEENRVMKLQDEMPYFENGKVYQIMFKSDDDDEIIAFQNPVQPLSFAQRVHNVLQGQARNNVYLEQSK